MPLSLLSLTTGANSEQETQSTLPVMKVLPVGSSMLDVRIPRFNKEYETTSLLTAKQMDILPNDKLKGSIVDVTIYKDNNPQATTHLKSAFYYQTKGVIHSLENLTISGDSFDIGAQGLILNWKKRAGFLLGKTETLFYSEIDKKMTSPVSTPQNNKSQPMAKTNKTVKAVAAVAVSIPALLSADELKVIDVLATPSTAIVANVDTQANKDISDMQSTASQIDSQKVELHSQLVQIVDNQTTPVLAAEPLTPQPTKVPVSVTCDNGMYFDATTGTVVYQKDIVVTHPQYFLTCTDELKVLLAKETKPANSETPSAAPSTAPKFSGIDKAIATGNVIIKTKDSSGKLIITHSEIATYDGVTGVMILKGNRPTVQQGDTIARVLSDSGYIIILPNRSVRIEGRHEIKANLNELQNNKQQ